MLLAVVLLAVVSSSLAVIRVDNRDGFKFCSGHQMAQVVSVEVDGPGCMRWPCLLFPGGSGAFRIKLYNPQEKPIHQLMSDIHGTLRFNGFAGIPGRQTIGMPGEVHKKACGFTNPGCPVAPRSVFEITKVITVPAQARMAHGKMTVKFKVKDGRGRTLTCFTAPVIIG